MFTKLKVIIPLKIFAGQLTVSIFSSLKSSFLYQTRYNHVWEKTRSSDQISHSARKIYYVKHVLMRFLNGIPETWCGPGKLIIKLYFFPTGTGSENESRNCRANVDLVLVSNCDSKTEEIIPSKMSVGVVPLWQLNNTSTNFPCRKISDVKKVSSNVELSPNKSFVDMP